MFSLLTALKYVNGQIIFLEDLECTFRQLKVVFELIQQISGSGLLKIILRLKQLTQYHWYHCWNRHVALVCTTVIQHPPFQWARNLIWERNGTRLSRPVLFHSTPKNFGTSARKFWLKGKHSRCSWQCNHRSNRRQKTLVIRVSHSLNDYFETTDKTGAKNVFSGGQSGGGDSSNFV